MNEALFGDEWPRGVSAKALWSGYLLRYWPFYLLGTISVVATNLCQVLVPKCIQWALDFLSGAERASFLRGLEREAALTRLLYVFGGVLVTQWIVRGAWRFFLARRTHMAAASMKAGIWDRTLYFPKRRLLTDLSPGELMNVSTSDVNTARNPFGFMLVSIIDFSFLFAFTVASMLVIDVELTLWALCLMPLLPFFIHKLEKRETQQHIVAQASLSSLTDLSAQAVSTVRMQRLTQSGPHWEQKLSQQALDYQKKRLDVLKTAMAFIPAVRIPPLVAYAVLIGLGLKKAMAGEISVGGFVAMQSYIYLLQSPLEEIGAVIPQWQQSFASLDRIRTLINTPEDKALTFAGEKVAPQEKVFEVQDLSFRYEKDARDLFRGLSFELRRGERLGIHGPIGTGKSTLVSILAAFTRDFEGHVKFHGRDVREYAHHELRRHIALVPQKPFLFADSVRGNLLIDAHSADGSKLVTLSDRETDDWLWHNLEMAGLAEDFRKFPDGLGTLLGEWGVNLSGGQKQRLTIARALVRKPKVLLMDDCLSAVDTVTEERILTHLDREFHDCTLLWVAHRASTLRHCHRVIGFQEGGLT